MYIEFIKYHDILVFRVVERPLMGLSVRGYVRSKRRIAGYKFAENLKKLREEKGLSQKQLGKLMFVAPSTIAVGKTAAGCRTL